MNTSVAIKRQMVKESIESQCNSFIEEKIDRYLEVEHQWIIGGHYFARASSECIYLYRDGYFIGAVMMSHAINEGIRLLANLQVEGIKFHHLYIVKNTELNRLYRAGNYKPIAQEDYVEMVAWALATLPKGTVIQRLTGDPPRNELVAPDWSLDKRQTITMIHDRIKRI
jgi:hypothetical protein